MIEAGLFVARFVHFISVCILFGLALHPFHAGAPGGEEGRRTRDLRTYAAVGAFAGGVLWLVFTAAGMSASLAAGFDPEILTMVVSDTSFGRVWAARLALCLLLIWLVRARPERSGLVALTAAVLVGSIALTGHGGLGERMLGPVHRVADSVHLLAAGAWIGGLAGLARLLVVSKPGPELEGSLKRFSAMGYFAVAAIVGTGLVNGWLLVGSLKALFVTTYGLVLLVKVALFGGMLGLALVNRFRLSPAIGKRSGTAALADLRRSVMIEQGLGFAVLAVVSVLGMLPPAVE